MVRAGRGKPIRRAVPEDLDALEALERRCFDAETRFSRASLASRLTSRHQEVWVVDADPTGSDATDREDAAEPPDGGIIGALILRPYRKSTRIESIAVAPSERRRGIGEALLRLARRRTASRGAARLVLETGTDDPDIVAWYHGRGFETVRRLPGHYGRRRHGLRMECLVPPSRAAVPPETSSARPDSPLGGISMQEEVNTFPVARRAKELEYAIRDVVLPAREVEAQGHKVLKLNIGDPAPYDFPVPSHMVEALHEAATQGRNGYGDSEGDLELRQAIADRERRRNGIDTDPRDVQVGTGVTEVLQMLLGATVQSGDEVLIPGPSYSPYEGLVKFFDGHPVEYRTDEADAWQPDIDDMRAKITENTRAIALINPNNPTGALYSRKRLQEIADLAGEYENQLFLISDEIYDDMALDGEHTSTAAVAPDLPVCTLNGFSKVYLVPGWRLGHIIWRDPTGRMSAIRDGFERIARNRLCPSTIAQRAALAALTGPQDHIETTRQKLKARRDLVHKRLNEIPGISSAKPDGAFYIFPRIDGLAQDDDSVPWDDDKSFVLDLLREQHVLTVHGSGFGQRYGKDHFRIVYLATEDILSESMDRIEAFMRKRVQ